MTEVKQYNYNKEKNKAKWLLLWQLCLTLLLLYPQTYAKLYAQKVDTINNLSTADDMLSKAGEILPQGDKDTDRLEAQRYYYKGRLQEAHKEYDRAVELYLKSDSLWADNAMTLHSLANCYRALHNGAKARHYYEKAYRLDSCDKELVFDLVQTYAQERQYDKASLTINRWLEQNSSDASALEYSAKLYYTLGEYAKAIERYNQIEKLNANDFSLCRQLVQFKAQLYRMLSEEGQAESEILSLVDKFPYLEEAKVFVISEFYGQKLYEKGLDLLKSYAKKGAFAQEEKDKLALIGLLALSRYQEAEAILERFLSNPKAELSVKIATLKEFVFGQSSDSEATKYEQLWERLLSNYSESAELRLAYAESLRLQKNFKRAIEVVRPLIKSEAGNKAVWEALIGDAISLEDIDLVSEFCLQAIDCIQDDWRNYFYASVGLYSKKDAEGAKAILMKGIKALESLENTDRFGLSMLYGQLGDLYGELGDEKEQIKLYDKALELNENNPSVLNNYAYHLSKKELRLNDAERMAALGVRLTPNDANLLETYAWILYQTKKYALANLYMGKAFDEGAKTNAISAIFYEHFGFIHLAQEEPKEAKECFEKALDLYPKELEQKTDNKAKQKEIKKAMRRLKKALKKL